MVKISANRRCPVLRGVDPDLRAARLIMARHFAVGTVPRWAILAGHWDGGSVIRAIRAQGGKHGNQSEPES